MAIKKPLVLKNGVTTELQSGDFLPLNAINGLSNDLDAIIQTIANISTANGSFKNESSASVDTTFSYLDILEISQSNDLNIFKVDGQSNSISINRDLPISILSTLTIEASSECDLTVKFVDFDTGETLSDFTHTISSGTFSFRESSLINVNRFLTALNPCKVVVELSATSPCLVTDFTGIVLASGGNGKIVTTNPLPIVGTTADIGYPINGGIAFNTAMVFLDLEQSDFDNFGKLLNNRDYLIEEHFGVTVNGSMIEFSSDLTGKYAVVSHVQ